MTVRAILDLKGRDVTTIAPDKTLGDAANDLPRSRKSGGPPLWARGETRR